MAGAAVLVLLSGASSPAPAYIDLLAGSLAAECKNAHAIALLRVEKVHRDRKAITYRKVRDLKGTLPPFAGETFTHVLGTIQNPERHQQDVETKDLQNDAILAWAAEGKTAVFFLGPGGACAICVGHAWYTTRGVPPAGEPWILRGAADSRLQRLYCGDADELVAAVRAILAGRPHPGNGVPRMVGTEEMVTDRTGPIVRAWGAPFPVASPWSTHRGGAQRAGADGGPGPRQPAVLWVHRSPDQILAPLVPGTKELFAVTLGASNRPGMRALALEPAGDRQVRWVTDARLLRQPITGAPALVPGPPELLIFGDGLHPGQGASLHCLRASDGLLLWQLPVPGKRVHFEGTPTVADGKLYVGGGSAGVLCVDPGWLTLEGKEMVPMPAPKRVWQQGQDGWHIDAPVAVVADRVLAASASLEDEKVGERSLFCLKADDGSVLWKTPLKLNPWAGPAVGPYVLVGCSSLRLDPKALAGARGEVVAVELDTGKVRWQNQVPGGVLSSVAAKGGLAVFTATDGKVRAWDAFTGRERWTYDVGVPFVAGVAVAKDVVYAADLRGVVHALRLADGRKEWVLDLAADPATRTTGLVYGSPVIHRGRLYLATCNPGAKATPSVVVCIGDK
jgi:outer membrane protein assembly factor BamB